VKEEQPGQRELTGGGRGERRRAVAVWRWQRAQARRLGVTAPLQGGAVGFLQLFGSALQLTPHLHLLLPEGLWGDDGDWVPLLPSEDDEVEAVLHRLLRQLRATFAALESRWPEEAEELLWAEAAQHRLPLEGDVAPKKTRSPPPARRKRLLPWPSALARSTRSAPLRAQRHAFARHGRLPSVLVCPGGSSFTFKRQHPWTRRR
jgi:hypothetical protein